MDLYRHFRSPAEFIPLHSPPQRCLQGSFCRSDLPSPARSQGVRAGTWVLGGDCPGVAVMVPLSTKPPGLPLLKSSPCAALSFLPAQSPLARPRASQLQRQQDQSITGSFSECWGGESTKSLLETLGKGAGLAVVLVRRCHCHVHAN